MLRSRWTLWLGLLAVLMAASVWDWTRPQPQDDLFDTTRPVSRALATAVSAAPVEKVEKARAGVSELRPLDLFAVRSWEPAPVKSANTRPQAASAPPLPFTYLGKVMEGESIVVFLSEGGRTHLVRMGDVVARYRVQEITANDMTLVYTPLEETQKLNFGSAN